ncbi:MULTISPECIES: acetyl-CoA carboxylase, carboxyltransferase subunit beta [Psychrilyobacter]|uniref:Acetyl-coenzyme A carboxylase carboxyl transferase subunit beta n=1 Tax=Psychrilyobacter piezotolerans TaxID=2293438 RepID=A0ABX9KGE5_9FUSO|nr:MULTISPECIES: acetyl-CoA carboxylase, carboxyltransferase subunit beta [Psychrilyobacter]MCS5421515.1 acetyl-CoA carboxylase, carboxyltransferase subunit beta [Psychrilyobacter sp. S5]NDI77742.1 acetyl-CoA carboxylase carboxyltransferase subunit beta [Psychrilyobacter piezotolerans]RDE61440.1 acetyl-CoA carboxylase carboxyltransferase subunit beta [Psychrilyobacter sp. S5]REI40961.1 acetyl-CoA carboxylase carboxyltransferase subunit beta [Psychrilyobacter piezotolerans]
MGIFSINKKKYATLKIEKKKVEKKEEPKKVEPNITGSGLWVKCPGCNEIIYKKDIKKNEMRCPNCDNYFKMSGKQRIELLIDKDTFEEFDVDLSTRDPLKFPDYAEKIENAKIKTKLKEGVISGIGKMFGMEVSIAAMDFSFLGGSMGTVVGEKITRAIERGVERKIPVIVVATSGGARMHEGILSLMQMAKTSAALDRLREKGIPFISIPVDPTTGGVTASFAMLGDVIISEPKALIGFAGPRVIEQTIKQKLPEGFQLSEFVQECGMVDIIAKREDLKKTVHRVLDNLFGL